MRWVSWKCILWPSPRKNLLLLRKFARPNWRVSTRTTCVRISRARNHAAAEFLISAAQSVKKP